ncbi:MAG: lysophospholipid acyltransferase family protein [bacterium]|nr:lysophospholipid acyltransferase family protein [bacterium]
MSEPRAIVPFILQTFVWIPTRIILQVFGQFEVRGLENLKELKGNVVFASNHSSELDPILLPASLPFFSSLSPIFYVSREKEFYNRQAFLKWVFYREWFFEIWGAYRAQAGKHDYEKSLKNHVEILSNGGCVFVFPEGEKTSDGKLLLAHGGVAYLSRKTGAPIVPVSISGVFKMRPSDFFLRQRKIILTFGTPIFPTTNDYKTEAQKVMDKIGEMLKK